MKVIYTASAQKELLEFQNRQKLMLEELISDRKLVYGDDVLEITASDIKEVSHQIQAIRPTVNRYKSTELITKAYVIMGLCMMVGAFYYPKIKEIAETNPNQAILFLVGGGITAVGLLFRYWMQFRQNALEERYKRLYHIGHSIKGLDDLTEEEMNSIKDWK